MPVPSILKELVSLPTASFAEHIVLDRIEARCRKLAGVTYQRDRYGNLLVRYRHNPPARTPLVLTAHTDHPGFVALEMLDAKRVRAAFRGYVEAPYFHRAKMRFFTGGKWVSGRVESIDRAVRIERGGRTIERPEEVTLRVSAPVAPGSPGMWDLPDIVAQGDLVYARDHDDMAGAAALLALFERLSKKRAAADVYGLFARAEEVGFVGAIGAIKARTIPKRLPVIVIEMSKELPNARIGDGPIIRVGDRLSVYTPELTAYVERVAKVLAKRKRKFASQRKLMDGGACEATAYAAYGYQTTGICLPLGNYHNMDTQRGKIAPEYISVQDWQRLVDLFEALVMDEQGPQTRDATVREDLDKRFNDHAALLA